MQKRGIPVTTGLDITKFLVDDTVVDEWALQLLPKDDLSIQNGIMVTNTTRYCLLIDPQEQGMTWIKNKSAERFDPKRNLTTLTNKRFVNCLKNTMEEGDCLLIDNIQDEVDPVLDPVLEKQYIIKGKTKLVSV
jgi:dynein heavy chain